MKPRASLGAPGPDAARGSPPHATRPTTIETAAAARTGRVTDERSPAGASAEDIAPASGREVRYTPLAPGQARDRPPSAEHRPQKGGHGRQALDILPWDHTAFGNLKTWLRGTFHGVSPKHLQRYLHEFVYRFDRRWREDELFGFVLGRAATGQPLPYHRLVAESGR